MSLIRQGIPAAAGVVVGALAVSHPDPRLINAAPASLPGYAQILLTGAHQCGGALIRPDVVITAAHCVQNNGPASLWVRANGQESGVSSTVIHPAYNKPTGTYDHDIAVVNLVTPITGAVLRLPTDVPPEGATVKAWGMGWTSWNGQLAGRLEALPMTVMAQQEGATAMGAAPHPGRLYAKTPTGTACRGDSGSPLMHGDQVVGLVAAVFSGCPAGSPVGFTSVLPYLAWIASVTEEQQPRPGWWCLASGCDGTGVVLASGAGTVYLARFYYVTEKREWTSAYLQRTAPGFYQGWASDCKPSSCSGTAITVDLRVDSPTAVTMTWGGQVMALRPLSAF